jgi:hypothetical protein
MVVAIERGRDVATRPTPRQRKASLSMQLQFTTSPVFGDPRLLARFWDKVHVLDNGCWEWQGGKSRGYGYSSWRGRNHQVHRLAFERLVGPIPEGLTIDHLCRNRACVNPVHLEPVTMRENILRGDGLAAREARRTHCVEGHEYSDANTYRSRGKRLCRECRRTKYRRK